MFPEFCNYIFGSHACFLKNDGHTEHFCLDIYENGVVIPCSQYNEEGFLIRQYEDGEWDEWRPYLEGYRF